MWHPLPLHTEYYLHIMVDFFLLVDFSMWLVFWSAGGVMLIFFYYFFYIYWDAEIY